MGGAVMEHPTDDELEAMAVTMADYCLHDVAAMLRAMKGRDSLAPAPDHAEWNAAIEAAAKVAQGQYRERSMLDPESPSYGIDMTPDRSDWGRGIQRGREQAAAAIRSIKKGPSQ